MKLKLMIAATALGCGAALASPAFAGGGTDAPCVFPPIGPDVIVGDLIGTSNYPAQGGLDAFSVGTTSCNVGDVWLNWIASTNQHPVIGQHFYRLKTIDGASRFEQLGQSWLKHGFYALSLTLCCDNCESTDGSHLGVGCSDPYNSARNGAQLDLGPKYQVNPHAGFFDYPPADPPFTGQMARRLQIPTSSLEVTGGPGAAQYFVEGHYIAPDDAIAGNGNNNVSYRPVGVSGGPTEWSFNLTGATQRTKPAIHAWKDNDPDVNIVDVQVPNDGLFKLGFRVTPLGNGWFHYEYALYNMNSDRAAGSLSFPVSGCVELDNIEFHDVHYHSGDGGGSVNYSDADWGNARAGNKLTWATEPFTQNINANAIRWGTTYNFRFDANVPPMPGTVTMGLFKAITPQTISIPAWVPQTGKAPSCPADASPPGGDGSVNINDLLLVISAWSNAGGPGDVEPPCGDGSVNVNDLLAVIAAYGPCP